jgi:hypothetical protein
LTRSEANSYGVCALAKLRRTRTDCNCIDALTGKSGISTQCCTATCSPNLRFAKNYTGNSWSGATNPATGSRNGDRPSAVSNRHPATSSQCGFCQRIASSVANKNLPVGVAGLACAAVGNRNGSCDVCCRPGCVLVTRSVYAGEVDVC